MDGLDLLATLRALVKAHAQPDPSTKRREPIFYIRSMGGTTLEHHALDDPPHVDDALLEEMSEEGLIQIDYGQNMWKLSPTALGRAAIQQQDRIEGRGRVGDIEPLVEALSAQAASENRFGWPVVRPVLITIRAYWEEAGYPPNGLPLRMVFNALPNEHQEMFSATVRSLLEGNYVRATPWIEEFELPAEVVLTEKAHITLDGWPGAEPAEIVENLLAVLTAAIAAEPDPVKRSRLKRLADNLRELGTEVAGEVLAKVLTGGL